MPVSDLTPDLLRQLYVDEDLTDGEIAERHGTYQVKVSRLRAQWGIPTRTKSERLRLPLELTPRLRSILIGSMLGDGGMQRTGSQTARFSEHHCIAQKPYLDWLVNEWGAFVSCTLSANKDGHEGFRMITHGCTTLFPYWKQFYPDEKGHKVFAHLRFEDVDALALAAWFMGDGSRTDSYIRLSVGPDEVSQRVQLGVLRALGLDVKLYTSSGDYDIHITNRGSMTRFVDLVAPHIHPSMAYKLDVSTPRRMGASPRDVLTAEALTPLVERGLRPHTIAEIFNVSRMSVCRALGRIGVSGKPLGRPPTAERTELTSDEATRVIEGMDPASPSFHADVVQVLQRTQIPLATHSDEDVQRDIELLRRSNTRIENDEFVQISTAGARLCDRYFDYRWDARYRENSSVRKAWYDARLLERAVQFQIRVNDPVTPTRVLRALKAIVRAPTNFRPSLAKAIVEMLCPPGGVVLDPCAGYGGRAAGTLAANRTYVGVDPHPDAAGAYAGLAREFGLDARLTFHNSPFEDVVLDGVEADLVFTSPPYFAVERYSDDASQSWVRYKTWESWRDGFLKALVSKAWAHLRVGGTLCINTKDIRDGRNTYPIAAEVVALAQRAGFSVLPPLALPLGRMGKEARFEPILLFSKGTASGEGARYVASREVRSAPRPEPVKSPPTRLAGLDALNLRALYDEQLLTDAEIAARFDVSDVLISQQRAWFGIRTLTPREREERRSGAPSLATLTPTRLRDLYATHSDGEIAKMYQTSKVTIRNRRHAWGIAPVSKTERAAAGKYQK